MLKRQIPYLVALILCSLQLSSSADDRILTLKVAAREGDLATVERLLSAGVPAGGGDINGSTPVHAAASGGRLEVLKHLLASGGRPDTSDKQGRRPLYEAAAAGSAECCRLLVEKGAALDATTAGGWSALDAALYWGSDEAALFLLEAGAKPTLVDADDTPLLVASRQGFPRTVQWLLQNGADPRQGDLMGRTPLHHAASFGGPEVVELLLEAGAEQNRLDREGYNPFELAAKHSSLESLKLLLPREKAPESALFVACGWASPETVKWLLHNGASTVPPGCVEAAAGRDDFDPACRILEHILPKVQLSPESLNPAVRVGNREAVGLLLKAGTLPGGQQAVLAAEMGRPEILQALLAAGAPKPPIEEVEERWDQRRELLQAIVEHYSGMRRLHPAEAAARGALRDLDDNRASLQSLLE